jgi:F-type H+-transporting ATPase subunit a
MITNLFSVFDPSTNLINLSLNWLRIFIGILCIPLSLWTTPSRYRFIWIKIISNFHYEFKIILNSINIGRTLIFISLFSMILYNNILGLFPYIFTRTSHIVITISLTLPLWLRFIIYGWLINYKHIFIHLVPQGTPSILISFIVCIETIRNFIRPITLAIRLSANIIAGHLLIALLGNTGNSLIFYILIFLLIIQILLIILECAVAVIQSYVFTVLRTLYYREVF